jgi:glyoxylase-like metal-dependent hydrolase (beta-lactamase superfamily II)
MSSARRAAAAGGDAGGEEGSGPPWRVEILVPAHRLVLALVGGEVVELRGSSAAGTFRTYRGLPEAVHGMIAWPNTVLLTGPATVIVDPGYQTQGDMLVGALAARGRRTEDVDAVVMTHLHADHLSALPQLGEVDVHAHELELDTPYGRRQRGLLDGVRLRPLAGDAGEILSGLRWIHTPGHSPGHIAVLVDAEEGLTAIAGDTLGPDPEWFARMELPPDVPERQALLRAFRRLRELDPAVVIPGHNPPVRLRAGGPVR